MLLRTRRTNVFELSVLGLVAIAFLCGGIIKGLSGIGLPMIALPILSIGLDVPTAVALTMVPILITNGWQALTCGRLLDVVRRFWPMQIVMAVTLIVASGFLTRIDNNVLLIITGIILSVSVIALVFARGWTIPGRLERPVGIAVGVLAGAIGGVSSLFGIPIIIYMSSLGLERADFLTSISVVYFLAAIPYVGSLLIIGGIPPVVMVVSALAVVPAMVGMTAAGRFAMQLDPVRSRRMLNGLLILMGFGMIARGIFDV